MAPEMNDSMLSMTLNCPALGVQSCWLVRVKNCEGDDLLNCINDFRHSLQSKDLIALDKEGTLTSGQQLLMEGLLFQRLAEWQERLRRCREREEEKKTWESKIQQIRVEYIREIEMYRLKLRAYERGRQPQDHRHSSMSGLRDTACQTEMQSPLGEIVSLWEKCLDLQLRLDRVNRRNMAFEKVEDCIFALHRAVLDDQHHNAFLEKALVEVLEAWILKTFALQEAGQMAMMVLDGRDVRGIQREELHTPQEVLRKELHEAISMETLDAIEAIIHGGEPLKSEQLVLQLRAMVRSLQDLQDGDAFIAKKKDPVAPGYVTNLLQDLEEEVEIPAIDPRVVTIREALSSVKALDATLEMVRSMSLKWRHAATAPAEVSAVLESIQQSIQEGEPSSQDDKELLPIGSDNLSDSITYPEALEGGISEHFVEMEELPASHHGQEELVETPEVLEASQDVYVQEVTPMVSDASTMTPGHLLLTSLLKSKDVVWTSVPLGSEKNFQWSLMPRLAQHEESRPEVETALQRMDHMLQALPSQVLAGHAPGVHWPSISSAAWSRLGGAFDLARITSDPPVVASAARQRCRGGISKGSTVATSCIDEEVLDLQPFASSIHLASSPRMQSKVPLPRQRRTPCKEKGVIENPLEQIFSSNRTNTEISLAPEGATRTTATTSQSKRWFQSRRFNAEQEEDNKMVQQWLERLREPLPAVARFEEAPPRHATSLVSVVSEVQDLCRRDSRESVQSEMHLFFDDASTETNSRPSTATASRPSSAVRLARPWTGRRPRSGAALEQQQERTVQVDDGAEVPERAPSAEEQGQYLPRAPAFVSRTPLRRIGRHSSKRPATAERKLHTAYVCHRPASAV